MTRALAVLLLSTACARAESDHGGGSPPSKVATSAAPTTATPTADPQPTDPEPAPLAKDDQAGVKAALAAAGVSLDDDGCVAWPLSFPRVVAIGSFAHDRGCETMGLLVDRRWHAGDTGIAAALATVGFPAATMERREGLARAWVDEVEHAFGDHFVTTSELAFELDGSSRFQPVIVRTNKLGAVVVEGWTREPSGMQDESGFARMRYTISPPGELQRSSEARFSVEGPRLREAEAKRDAAAVTVDMSGFDLTCKRDADCTLVKPSPCSPCGCESTPLAKKDQAAFDSARKAIVCPPPAPLPGGAGCGSCVGSHPKCRDGRCAAEHG
ncbi:MAG: hypothetical protein K1X88_22075 [Nannocystaceae bacterium]|nr:hypothetical protein [Nannocystaceae bacterium]